VSSPDAYAAVHEQLFARRMVVVDRPLDAETAALVAAQLLALDGTGDEPITVVVNSPGGPLDAAGAVLGSVDLVACPVDTMCIGRAAGTAAVLAASGTGRRRIGAAASLDLRLADIALSGSATRVRDDVEMLRQMRQGLIDRLVATTGQERRLIERDIDRGRVLSAVDAVTYGLADEVVEPRGG
jgi:ATP-dependent Clp protease protease subunit